MGGKGSGNFSRTGQRDTTDQYQRLDIRAIYRAGLLRPGWTGTSRWRRGEHQTGSIGWTVWGAGQRAIQIVLEYRVGDDQVSDPIAVTWTTCNFGGVRPWFRCPGCNRRVAILYGGRLFRCRHCYRLAYESTREDDATRLWRRSEKYRERLGGSDGMRSPLPGKPRGMHSKTFERLCHAANEAEYESWHALAVRFGLASKER